MADVVITDEEWDVFTKVAERLGIDVDGLGDQVATFTELESAAHQLGQAVAQSTSERLCAKQAARALSQRHVCPDCGRGCRAELKDREFVTTDGIIQLHEPVCHCSTCRRDFFPSAPRNED